MQTELIELWPIVIAIFGAGLGWGVHQVTLTLLSKTVGKLETKVERLEEDVNVLGDRLTRIESKLDMVLRNVSSGPRGQSLCGD